MAYPILINIIKGIIVDSKVNISIIVAKTTAKVTYIGVCLSAKSFVSFNTAAIPLKKDCLFNILLISPMAS